jgi:nucleoside-diphosphate-sugar epimerase
LAHRDDIAAAIWAAFGAPSSVADDIFNVADDTPTPKAEVAAWLAARLGVPVPQFSGEPMSGRRAVTPDRVISAAKIKRVLGWRPRYPTFRDGYEKMLSR